MIYNVEDIFSDHPTDPNSCIMTFPPEIVENLNLHDGDTVTVTVENDTIIIRKNE